MKAPTTMSRERSGETETAVAVPERRNNPEAIGRARDARFAAPRTATQHTHSIALTTTASPFAAILRRTFVAIVATVLHPFPYVTAHVV